VLSGAGGHGDPRFEANYECTAPGSGGKDASTSAHTIATDGTVVRGTVASPHENAVFGFAAKGGVTYQVDVQLSGSDGGLEDSVLDVMDRDGTTVQPLPAGQPRRPLPPPPHPPPCLRGLVFGRFVGRGHASLSTIFASLSISRSRADETAQVLAENDDSDEGDGLNRSV
jgi:hypothetical protein